MYVIFNYIERKGKERNEIEIILITSISYQVVMCKVVAFINDTVSFANRINTDNKIQETMSKYVIYYKVKIGKIKQ